MSDRQLRVLRVESLGVDFGARTALDDITMTVPANRPVAVTGPSGSGKTVLLHAVAGLLPPTRGEVLLDGAALAVGDHGGCVVGVVLQSHGLASGLTAEENVALPLQAQGLHPDETARRCSEALAAVDLGEAAGRVVDDLSGGQRQRVGVARALAMEPDILVADEPTAELDPANRSRVLSLLLDGSPERIVLVASNDPEVAAACHQVVHLRDGRIVTTDVDTE
jgi:putative ABC transport system ATP-binding protein